jgi:hypothetical protein
MIKNIITPGKLYLYEPTLQKLVSSDRLQNIINEAHSEIIIDLKNRGYKNWQSCYPLDLVYLTEPTNEFESDFIEDEIERNLLSIQSDGEYSFKLYGKNLDNKVFTIFEFNHSNNVELVFYNNFKYYKVKLQNCNFNNFYASLININFYKANIFKALEITLRGLSTTQADSYFEKANLYKDLYVNELQNLSIDVLNEDTLKSEIQSNLAKNIEIER